MRPEENFWLAPKLYMDSLWNEKPVQKIGTGFLHSGTYNMGLTL